MNNSVFFGLNMQPVGMDVNLNDLFLFFYQIANLLSQGVAASVTDAFTDDEGDLYDAASDFLESTAPIVTGKQII